MQVSDSCGAVAVARQSNSRFREGRREGCRRAMVATVVVRLLSVRLALLVFLWLLLLAKFG